MDRLLGVVSWFDVKKGFGFIRCESKDYFVHYKAIQGIGFKELKQGQKVTFGAKKSDKGFTAECVVIVGMKDESN